MTAVPADMSRGADPVHDSNRSRKEGGRLSARILLVGGEDSSGRAGLPADRETVEALCQARVGEFPLALSLVTVATAHTVQVDEHLIDLGERDPDEWCSAVRRILEDGHDRPVVAKFGLLPGRRHLAGAAQLIRLLMPSTPVVLDPVAASSGGAPFLSQEDLAFLVARVLPAGPILTPNIPEAALLTGAESALLAADPSSRQAAAAQLLAAGASGVVLKGGHGDEDPVRDLVLMPGRGPEWILHPRVPGSGIRGSGCRHATALALGLAQGLSPVSAARLAAAHLTELLKNRG